MALKTVDLTQQPDRVEFTGCSEDEIGYAKTFWQSLQLLPPMESRLVSSDIKQRLRKAPPSRSQSNYTSRQTVSEDSSLHFFFARAKTMEQIEEMRKYDKFASARAEERALLHKHRVERMKKEEISRPSHLLSSTSQETAASGSLSIIDNEEDESDHNFEDNSLVVEEEIRKFEKMKGEKDEDDSD
ncbi:UPF0722 protein-like [Pomacea canaliculata]|uniref:UPF0722 protein-like n=1 Tax=Pomacea canaliculata TaxID=400727 RepID=UPI000D7341AC|nr:UPF0722 protein-like [Pomacea canaliculata]